MEAGELRPLGVGELLDAAIKIYRARFATLVKAVGVVVGPVSVLSAVVQVSTFPDSEEFGAPGEVSPEADFEFAELGTFLAGALVVGLLGFIASQLATAASFRVVSGVYLDDEADWKESLRFARSRLGSLLWLSIVLGFFLVLGFLACVVPGVYLWGAWAVAVPALLLEDLRGMDALKRSRALVRGRWWTTATVLVLALILATIVQFIFSGLLSGVVAASSNDLVNAVAQAVANTAGSILTTPFAAAVTTALYFDLRVRKEGFDLELLARRVGVEPPSRPGTGPTAPSPPPSDEAPYWPPPPGWRPPDD